jgi:hypothetical protein
MCWLKRDASNSEILSLILIAQVWGKLFLGACLSRKSVSSESMFVTCKLGVKGPHKGALGTKVT